MINRTYDFEQLTLRITNNPVTAILGPRQSGKTTLAKTFQADDQYDLENPLDLARLENPMLELKNKKGLVIIDEIQRKPDLFPVLRYLVDTYPQLKFLILGSASRDLLRQSSETLAGRITYYYLYGFRISDFPEPDVQRLWLNGSFPRSILSSNNAVSYQWRNDYIKTYLERDIPQLGINIPAETLRRFWIMLSHYHGNILNYSELSRSFGLSDKTIKHYIDILAGTFMIRILRPYYANIGKRLVKSPKIYIQDSGILHSLLQLSTMESLKTHPKLGASWEGFALDALIRHLHLPEEYFYFYATHSDCELDLFWQNEAKNYGAEFKYTDAVKLTKSMQIAFQDLNLTKLWVIYPGDKAYDLAENIEVIPLSQMNLIGFDH